MHWYSRSAQLAGVKNTLMNPTHCVIGCCLMFKITAQKWKTMSHIKLLPSFAQNMYKNSLKLLCCTKV